MPPYWGVSDRTPPNPARGGRAPPPKYIIRCDPGEIVRLREIGAWTAPDYRGGRDVAAGGGTTRGDKALIVAHPASPHTLSRGGGGRVTVMRRPRSSTWLCHA